MFKTFALWVLALFASTAIAKDLSLAGIREILLGQEVLVLGPTFRLSGQAPDSLRDWYFVERGETQEYKKVVKVNPHAPATIRGTRGYVISVEEANVFYKSKKVGETDPFGEPIDASRVINPYIQVVVKIGEDANFVAVTNYFSNMMGRSIQLASRAGTLATEIQGHLASLIGKPLYKTGYSEVFDGALSLPELLDDTKRRLARDFHTKNLTPMKVMDAKFLEDANAVVLKVELPDGQTRLLFGDLYFYDSKSAAKSILERMGISAVGKIPSTFSAKELSAIKEGKIFRGMSEDALFCSWGYPKKTNDWGKAGEQHVYGRQYVYVEGKTVRDWQSIGE